MGAGSRTSNQMEAGIHTSSQPGAGDVASNQPVGGVTAKAFYKSAARISLNEVYEL